VPRPRDRPWPWFSLSHVGFAHIFFRIGERRKKSKSHTHIIRPSFNKAAVYRSHIGLRIYVCASNMQNQFQPAYLTETDTKSHESALIPWLIRRRLLPLKADREFLSPTALSLSIIRIFPRYCMRVKTLSFDFFLFRNYFGILKLLCLQKPLVFYC
jgi:hypothetical protein